MSDSKFNIKSWWNDRIEIFDKLRLRGQDKPGTHSENAATAGWNGFDREAMLAGSKELGVIEFCLDASSGIVYSIGHEKVSDANNNNFEIKTGQTTFGDGSVLVSRKLVHFPASGETFFKYWWRGDAVFVTVTKSAIADADWDGYVYYDADGNFILNSALGTDDLIKNTVLVTQLYLNPAHGAFTHTATGNAVDARDAELVWFADERHGTLQSGEDHLQAHGFPGFRLQVGLTPSNFLIGEDHWTAISFGIGADEDIANYFLPRGAGITGYEGMAKIHRRVIDAGGTLRYTIDTTTTEDRLYAKIVGGNVKMDEDGFLVNSATYTPVTLVASNNKIAPIFNLIAQESNSNRRTMRRRLDSAWERVELGFPSHEFARIFVGLVDGNGDIYAGDDGETGYDYRNIIQTAYFE